MKQLSSMLCVLVPLVLLSTGVIHALQPYYFVHTIASYQLLPKWMVGTVGLIVPYAQVVLGLGILFGPFERVSLFFASTLFALFAAAQASVLWRSLQVDCGCFGFISSKVSLATLSVPLVMLAACVWLLSETNPSCQR